MASVAAIEPKIINHNHRKTFYGVGFNSRGRYKSKANGRQTTHYKAWRNMLERCYCPKLRTKYRTYADCVVTSKWFDFQVFAEWFLSQENHDCGYDLDKDILSSGSKIYSPDTCCFIPQQLNKLLVNPKLVRGKYPLGVNLNKPMNKYCASMKVEGVRKHLGYFDCPNEAYQVYKKAKEANVKRMALKWRNLVAENVFQALMDWELPDLDYNN